MFTFKRKKLITHQIKQRMKFKMNLKQEKIKLSNTKNKLHKVKKTKPLL